MTKKIISIFVLALSLGMCSTTPQVEERFTVDIFSPQFPAGEFETQIDKTFPLTGLKKIIVTVSYFPYEDAVCLRYRTDFFTYYQFWSLSGREAFIGALEKYSEDYTERNLDSRNRRSRNNYGVIEGYLYWQMLTITRRVMANMDVELGYFFKEGAPYYAVTQKLTTYVDPISSEDNMNSQEITMYFTRAQAQELVALFDQEYLFSLIPPELGGWITDPNIDIDEY